MSQPLEEAGSEPTRSGQSKTLFVQEGNPACVLVTRTGQKMRQKAMKFATSLAAFEWCCAGSVGMVYEPADPGRN